eukprot:2096444-Pleurochrysis_carterae.AAC.1
MAFTQFTLQPRLEAQAVSKNAFSFVLGCISKFQVCSEYAFLTLKQTRHHAEWVSNWVIVLKNTPAISGLSS